jgi:hypothetical protein
MVGLSCCSQPECFHIGEETMPKENLDVYSTLFDAMNAPPAGATAPAAPGTGRAAAVPTKPTEREAQLLYRLQVDGPSSMEALATKAAIPLGDVVATVSDLRSKGYVAVGEARNRNLVELTTAGTSLTLGEM